MTTFALKGKQLKYGSFSAAFPLLHFACVFLQRSAVALFARYAILR